MDILYTDTNSAVHTRLQLIMWILLSNALKHKQQSFAVLEIRLAEDGLAQPETLIKDLILEFTLMKAAKRTRKCGVQLGDGGWPPG